MQSEKAFFLKERLANNTQYLYILFPRHQTALIQDVSVCTSMYVQYVK